jgi:hypothetical protein
MIRRGTCFAPQFHIEYHIIVSATEYANKHIPINQSINQSILAQNVNDISEIRGPFTVNKDKVYPVYHAMKMYEGPDRRG